MMCRKTTTLTLFLLLLTTMAVAVNGLPVERHLKKRKNLRRQPAGRQGMQRKCRHDGHCPRIECVTTPCYQQVCIDGECVTEEPPVEEEVDEQDEGGGDAARGGSGRMGCQSSRDCPMLRCAVGYPCPSFECQERLCVDVSNGEPFAPCGTDEDCFREGDVCTPDGKCIDGRGEQTLPPNIGDGTTRCSEEQACPQPTCLQGTYCPFYVCEAGICVPQETEVQTLPPDIGDGTTRCSEEQACPQHTCLQGTYCPFYVCEAGICVPQDTTLPPSIGDKTSCSEEQPCPQHTCLQGTYCPFYVCQAGTCVPQSGNECGVDDDCPQPDCPPELDFCPRLICMDGFCVTDDQPRPDDCQVDDDCPQPGCPPEMEVCPRFFCTDGRCVVEDLPPFDECRVNSDCPPPCPPEEDCPNSVSCENGMCIYEQPPPECRVASDCPPPCLPEEDCPDSVSCESGTCLYEQPPPECENDLQCPQPGCLPDSTYCPYFVCRDGTCVEGRTEPVMCTQDVKMCPDGSYVSRVGPNCEFGPCPVLLKCTTTEDCDIPEQVCDTEQGLCVDMNDIGCPEDLLLCSDGTSVPRVPPSCDFAPCPTTEPSDGRCESDEDCDFPNEECNLELGSCVDGFGHIKCGPVTWCEPEQVCCNPSCGICTDPEGVCTQQICPPATVESEPCGPNICTNGQVCCNASCGICVDPGRMCTQQACLGPPEVDVVVECCKAPRPSDAECGRSGCHCCGNGEWMLGHSGPSLVPEEACGDLGVSEACSDLDITGNRPCETDSDCPPIACFVAPCPENVCQKRFCTIPDV